MLDGHLLARFPADPNPFLASQLHPALSACPCEPPSGPGWLHEIKFDGYRVVARQDEEQVRLWARTIRRLSLDPGRGRGAAGR